MIGCQKRRINIVPDYLLTVNDKNGFVLDAKAPTESIVKSPNVEQTSSYAMHPDVRVPIYVLCNGRDIVVYDVQEWDPIFSCPVNKIDQNWDNLARILSPDAIANPRLRKFMPDFGLRAVKAGFGSQTVWFLVVGVDNFLKESDDLITACALFDDNGVECLASLDLPTEIFREVLGKCDSPARAQIKHALSQYPYQAKLREPLTLSFEARLAERIQSSQTGEVFVPFIVQRLVE
jgi:hypothetical protein